MRKQQVRYANRDRQASRSRSQTQPRARISPVVKFFGVAALVTGLLSALAFAAPSKSGLVFCNRGSQGRVQVAVALPSDNHRWTTHGWLALNPGQCETAVPGQLSNRFYYYFAETDKNYAWQGSEKFCVSDDKFTFLNADRECQGTSSRWVRFRELDTGKDADSYVLNLE